MKTNENCNSGPVGVLAALENLAHAVQADMDESDCRRARAGIREARAAVAELVRRSIEMLEQDQCRFATYNAAPHMATAVDNLRAALAKFGGA